MMVKRFGILLLLGMATSLTYAATFPGTNPQQVVLQQSSPVTYNTIKPSSQTERTEKLVHKAVAYVKKHGKMAAICEFNKLHGHFHHGSDYVFAFVCNNGASNGIFIADPITPQYNFTQQTDNPLITGMVKAIEKQPDGIWYQYCWYDPKTNQFEKKESYIKMIPEEHLCVGSGYYFKTQRCLNPAL
ncbi:MAG: hypothetical protein GY821_08700 [Gammaproteobacteria bacterium]|nr:hypothetical protein [Gammaproteobacteria bacterium]